MSWLASGGMGVAGMPGGLHLGGGLMPGGMLPEITLPAAGLLAGTGALYSSPGQKAMNWLMTARPDLAASLGRGVRGAIPGIAAGLGPSEEDYRGLLQ